MKNREKIKNFQKIQKYTLSKVKKGENGAEWERHVGTKTAVYSTLELTILFDLIENDKEC